MRILLGKKRLMKRIGNILRVNDGLHRSSPVADLPTDCKVKTFGYPLLASYRNGLTLLKCLLLRRLSQLADVFGWSELAVMDGIHV